MKIAVCISGQPRSYAKGYEYLKKNLFDKHDCDVFMHSWYNPVYESTEIVDLYAPKRYRFDPRSAILEEEYNKRYTNVPGSGWYPPYATISMFYSMFKSLQLKCEEELTSSHYDWVIRTRFDYALNGVIPFEKLDPTKLYIPNCRMVPTKDFGNDQFAFGSSKVMTEYMSTYLYLRQFYDEGVQLIGEDMMSANIKRAGLVGDRLVYANMNNPFPPGKYNGTPHSLIRDDMELWTNS